MRFAKVTTLILSTFLLSVCGGSGTKTITPDPPADPPDPPAVTTAAPTFNPLAGSVASGTTVTLTDATADAVIHFTVDGSVPSQSSPVYSAPIAVAAAEKISALAIASGDNPSAVASAQYTIDPPSDPSPPSDPPPPAIPTVVQVVTTPSITLAGGTGDALVVVQIQVAPSTQLLPTPPVTDANGTLVPSGNPSTTDASCSPLGDPTEYFCVTTYIELAPSAGVHNLTPIPVSAETETFLVEFSNVTHGLDNTVIGSSISNNAWGTAGQAEELGGVTANYPNECVLVFGTQPGAVGLLAGVQQIEGNSTITGVYADQFWTLESFSTLSAESYPTYFYTTGAGWVSSFGIGVY
jgi:hypothetical protein